jgi:hypothetical protein
LERTLAHPFLDLPGSMQLSAQLPPASTLDQPVENRLP